MKNEKKNTTIKILSLIAVPIAYLLLSKYLFSLAFVSGNSMANTVCNNGLCIEKKFDFEIERYDIVVAKVPRYDAENGIDFLRYESAIKRVIGLPNDTIDIQNGNVFVNGNLIDKFNYNTEAGDELNFPITLNEDEYFLLGDNREISYDSRAYGCIKVEDIEGKIIQIIFKGKYR